jgi:hypothetical protein
MATFEEALEQGQRYLSADFLDYLKKAYDAGQQFSDAISLANCVFRHDKLTRISEELTKAGIRHKCHIVPHFGCEYNSKIMVDVTYTSQVKEAVTKQNERKEYPRICGMNLAIGVEHQDNYSGSILSLHSAHYLNAVCTLTMEPFYWSLSPNTGVGHFHTLHSYHPQTMDDALTAIAQLSTGDLHFVQPTGNFRNQKRYSSIWDTIDEPIPITLDDVYLIRKHGRDAFDW